VELVHLPEFSITRKRYTVPMIEVALSIGPNRIDVSPHYPEVGSDSFSETLCLLVN
jgi:hypothetical protein